MTAEIAILNKLAVALAADSAVTISTTERDEKIFDTADKLFELSRHDPIGIMIYNGMDFAEVPFQTIVHMFRGRCASFSTVEDAATQFLFFLNEIGRSAPSHVQSNQIEQMLTPLLKRIDERRKEIISNYANNIPEGTTAEEITSFLSGANDTVLDNYMKIIQRLEDASFVGSGALIVDDEAKQLIQMLVEKILPLPNDGQREKALSVCVAFIGKKILSDNLTGIVITGFGSGEMFPTLTSFEIDGMICGRLKYVKTNSVDIDRRGKRAAVIPFAQKEMVERFLYGIDESIQNDISAFCESSVKTISKSLLDRVQFADPSDRAELEAEAKAAESAFADGLISRNFKGIRSQSQSEIEDMVEFMPKPELAKMAEALVNLTSIKRKVSRGFETVGGPIDVALISQSEGFIWVKRKHYFDPMLNGRYFQRAQLQMNQQQEESDASPEKPRSTPRKRHKSRNKG